jgi:hypothetical protein
VGEAVTGYELRGLEIHNNRMWRWSAIRHALELMQRFELNALVLHQNDLVDELVLPSAFFDDDVSWQRWPVRLARVSAHQSYLRRLVESARAAGIGVFLEVKELWYPDAILERFPELRTAEGNVCPTDPFWMEFLAIKLDELLETIPGIAGLIVSPATRESRVSIAANPCACDRCRRTDAATWYRTLIHTMYAPMAERGKILAIRDFAYSVEQQDMVLQAAAAVSPEIVAALKNVPHDFWPTFPDNPRIGQLSGQRQWIEYDVWGQYCGLGVFPVSLVQDLRRRLRSCREKGATGIWFRTDWEVLDEASVFNSPNLLNLVAGAVFSRDPEADPEAAYAAWMACGLRSPLIPESVEQAPVIPSAPDAEARLRAFMEASWSVIEKTLFVRGHVFQYSSRYHHSLAEIDNIMFSQQGREKWDPGSTALVAPGPQTDRAIIDEKETACREVDSLEGILQPRTLGVPASFADDLLELLDLYRMYVRGFAHVARAWVAARAAAPTARHELEELTRFRATLEARLAGTRYPFYVYWMMDTRELERLETDISSTLG